MALWLPDTDINTGFWLRSAGASPFWSYLDDDPASPDGLWLESPGTSGDSVLSFEFTGSGVVETIDLQILGETPGASRIQVINVFDLGILYFRSFPPGGIALTPGVPQTLSIPAINPPHNFVTPRLQMFFSDFSSEVMKVEALRLNATIGSGGGSGPGGQLGPNASILIPLMVQP